MWAPVRGERGGVGTAGVDGEDALANLVVEYSLASSLGLLLAAVL